MSIIPANVFGGAHNQAARLNRPLAKRGWATSVVLPDGEGDAASRLQSAGVEVHIVRFGRLRAIADPRAQLRFAAGTRGDLRRLRNGVQQADIVQVHGSTNPQGAIAARAVGAGVVWQLLDTRAPMPLRRLAMPVVMRLADVVMTTGRTVAALHPGIERLGSRLIPFVPPVDTESFRPDAARRSAARATLGVTGDAIVVGSIGNRNPQKGHEHLVRAAARLGDGVELRIRGARSPAHAAYERALLAEGERAGLTPGWLGELPSGMSVAELLPGFDVFALASVPRSEGIPTVILEAMACGIPVVATDVGGVSEVVQEGVTGFVVAPLAPEAMAHRLAALCADADLRVRLGTAGRTLARQRFDLERCADLHARAYALALLRRNSREPGYADR